MGNRLNKETIIIKHDDLLEPCQFVNTTCHSVNCTICNRKCCKNCYIIRDYILKQYHCKDCSISTEYQRIFSSICAAIFNKSTMDINIIHLMTSYSTGVTVQCCNKTKQIKEMRPCFNEINFNTMFEMEINVATAYRTTHKNKYHYIPTYNTMNGTIMIYDEQRRIFCEECTLYDIHTCQICLSFKESRFHLPTAWHAAICGNHSKAEIEKAIQNRVNRRCGYKLNTLVDVSNGLDGDYEQWFVGVIREKIGIRCRVSFEGLGEQLWINRHHKLRPWHAKTPWHAAELQFSEGKRIWRGWKNCKGVALNKWIICNVCAKRCCIFCFIVRDYKTGKYQCRDCMNMIEQQELLNAIQTSIYFRYQMDVNICHLIKEYARGCIIECCEEYCCNEIKFQSKFALEMNVAATYKQRAFVHIYQRFAENKDLDNVVMVYGRNRVIYCASHSSDKLTH
eukprot:514818_1